MSPRVWGIVKGASKRVKEELHPGCFLAAGMLELAASARHHRAPRLRGSSRGATVIPDGGDVRGVRFRDVRRGHLVDPDHPEDRRGVK